MSMELGSALASPVQPVNVGKKTVVRAGRVSGI
jgi:hypothetical protein